MKYKIPPRANMPSISNAAHKMLAKSILYNKSANQETIKTISPEEREASLKECHQAKQVMLPRLKELKQTLDDANLAYQLALDNWKNLSSEYEKIDYKEKMLIHEQKAVTQTKNPSTKKPLTQEQVTAKLAMKILANLSPEKQAEIMALIKKQAS